MPAGKPGPSLTDAFLKTVRAREHLEALQEQLERFKETKPHRFHIERDIRADKYRIHVKLPNIPDRVWLIVGDFLTCLRASLDHLVWSLSALTQSYPRYTEFPILDVPNDKVLRHSTRGVPLEARHIIEQLQPYQGRDQVSVRSHFLWRLNKLCNIDKHRRVPIHSHVSIMNFPDFPKRFSHLVERDADNGIVSVPLRLERYMRVDPETSFNVIIGDSVEGIEMDLEVLVGVYRFVTNDVLPRFGRFFV